MIRTLCPKWEDLHQPKVLREKLKFFFFIFLVVIRLFSIPGTLLRLSQAIWAYSRSPQRKRSAPKRAGFSESHRGRGRRGDIVRRAVQTVDSERKIWMRHRVRRLGFRKPHPFLPRSAFAFRRDRGCPTSTRCDRSAVVVWRRLVQSFRTKNLLHGSRYRWELRRRSSWR